MVRDRLVGKEFGVRPLEGIHLLHVRLRVLVGNDLGGGRELDVAASVIGVRVRVDDHRHRLVCDRLNGFENRPTPARQLCVDQHDAVVAHQGQRVAAATRQDVEDVPDVQGLHPDDPGRVTVLNAGRH